MDQGVENQMKEMDLFELADNPVENDPNIFQKARCGVCKKRIATLLCDFVIEYRRPVFYKSHKDFTSQELRGTCDLPMCEECTQKHNGIYDFCPHHQQYISKIQPTKEMKKSINAYAIKELFK